MPLRRHAHAALAVALCVAAALGLAPASARAHASASDRVYVVAARDTLTSIAAHLGVTVRALAERNHLAPPYPLRVGRALRLPDGVAPAVLRTLPAREPAVAPVPAHGHESLSHHEREALHGGPHAARAAAAARWGRPRTPGLVRLIREENDETLALSLRRISRTTRRRMQHLLRYPDGRAREIDDRLLRQLATVSDHFGGRTLRVISGYRPYRRGQYTAHSNHNVGRAVDFRVDGVPNRTLRDFCRTLPRTGCGFYPRSVFVHMDVREESTTWVDWSRPGQRPIYGREDHPPDAHAPAMPAPTGAADESVDDVAAENPRVREAMPADDSAAAATPDAPDAPAPNAASPPPPAMP